MSNIVIIISIIISTSCYSTKITAQNPPITDTLQWLKVNIEQKNSYFYNKPFSAILDTLQVYGLKNKLTEYLIPNISYDQPAHTLARDTIKTRILKIYLEDFFNSPKLFSHDTNPNINTHIKWIYMEFFEPIPYPNSVYVKRSTAWHTIENLVKNYTIYRVSVGEY
jgi:hypothetical protein